MACQVQHLKDMTAGMATSSSTVMDTVDITGVPVAVAWSGHDGQICYLSSCEAGQTEAGYMTFDCHFRPSSSSGSLRLRVPMLLKGQGRKTVPLFFFIAPERVQSLVFSEKEGASIPDVIRAALGDGVIAQLRVVLKQPADLVVPPFEPLTPKKKAFWDIFDSAKMLAQQSEFMIYLKQNRLLSKDGLEALSKAMSSGNLTTSTEHADVSRLYDGKGGKLLTSEHLAIHQHATAESPPTYDEVPPPPPGPPLDKGTFSLCISCMKFANAFLSFCPEVDRDGFGPQSQ